MRPAIRSVIGQARVFQPVIARRPEWWPNPPLPPGQNYTIPGGATVVTTMTQLATELAKTTAEDISVAAGTYSNTGPITPAASHRIWCQDYKNCVFNFGLMWGNRKSWEVHGGTWNVPDTTHAANEGTGKYSVICNFSGSTLGINAKVTDVTISGPDPALGGSPLLYGIYFAQPDGCIVQRVKASYFVREGVYWNDTHSNSSAVLNTCTDIDVAHIYDNPRGNLNGAHEFGVEAGNSVANGVRRIRVRDTGIGGMQCINKVWDSEFSDFDFDSCWGYEPVNAGNTHVGMVDSYGLYIERWTRRCTFKRFRIGLTGDINRGINNEWDYNLDFQLASTYTIGDATMFLSQGALTNMPATGTVYIGSSTTEIEATSPGVAIAYTGTQASPLAITGCSGGSGGPFPAGTWVSVTPGGNASSHSCVYKEGTVNAASTRGAIAPATPGTIRPKFGIQLDQGCTHPTVRDIRFRGKADVGCVADHTGMPAATSPATSQLQVEHCDFSGRQAGSPDINYGPTNA